MIRHNLCANLSADLILAIRRLKYNVKHLLTHPTPSGLIAVLGTVLWALMATEPVHHIGVVLKPTSHPLTIWQVINANFRALNNQSPSPVSIPTTLSQYELAAPLTCLIIVGIATTAAVTIACSGAFVFHHHKQICRAIIDTFIGTAHAFVFVCNLLADALGFVIEVLTWVPIHVVYPLWRRYHINVRDAVLQKQLSAKK